MIKALTTLIKSLSSNTNPGALAHAFCCGMLLGFLPKNNILWYILFILICFMRIQRTVFSLSTLTFSLLSPLFDPFFHNIGFWILSLEKASPFYSFLLNIPFVAFTKFNNTIVAGSFVFGIIAYIPLFVLSILFIKLWRKYFAEKIRNTRIVKIMKGIPFVQKISEITGYNYEK